MAFKQRKTTEKTTAAEPASVSREIVEVELPVKTVANPHLAEVAKPAAPPPKPEPVKEVTQLSDGTIEVRLENGQVLKLTERQAKGIALLKK